MRHLVTRIMAAGVVLAWLPISAQALDWLPERGRQQFTLGGTGSSDRNFDSVILGGSVSYGWYMSRSALIDLRQSVTYFKDDRSRWFGTTRGAFDWHFGAGRTRPFVGANIGATYGDGVKNTGIAGPELGLKHFANETTFVFGMAEYQVFFSSGDELESFRDGSLVYTFGMGLTF